MSATSQHRDVLHRLLDRHGRTFADEAGIRLGDTPAPLFELLVLTALLAANVDSRLGVRTAAAFRGAGIRTAAAMAEAGDQGRLKVLSEARYLRKEQTARQLGELADRVLEAYAGDLRRLRDRADGDPGAISAAIQDFTGIGQVGADIFCREAQAVWPGLRPFADEKVTAVARALGLPATPAGLADLTGSTDLAVVGAALVRCDMAGDAEELRVG